MTISPEEFVQGMMSRGLPRVHALAFAGNGKVESRLDPSINEISPTVPGSRGGFGLMQWTGPRRRQLEAYAASQKRDVADAEVQMDFLAWELQNTEKAAGSAILSATNVRDAARLVSERFLRPGIPHLDRRIAEAEGLANGTATDAAPAAPARDFSALHTLYNSGKMTDAQRQVYERGLAAGLIPKAEEKQAANPLASAPQPVAVPQSIADAYRSGQITGPRLDGLQKALDSGRLVLPEATSPAPTEPPLVPFPDPNAPASAPAPTPNLSADLSADGLGLASRALGGITGSGPDVVDIPDSVPLGVGGIDVPIPGPVQRFGEEAANFVLGGAGLASAGFGALVGGVGDLAMAAGADPQQTQRLANDVMAAPEAFAGSPGALVRPRSAPVRPGPRTSAPDAPPVAAAPIAAASAPDAAQIGNLVREASAGGVGSAKAQQKLADAAKVNREAFDAAQRLGIDLPADVFSDNQMIREAAGLTRSVAGSDASAAWRETIVAAADKADEAMRALDGSPDIASVSDGVLSSLRSTQAQLKAQADSLYSKVDGAIPKNTQIEPNNIVRALNGVISELGGPDGMTAQERALFGMVTGDQPVTYARLMREKNAIGKALRGQESPYGSVDEATLKRLYGAIAEDQLANVERVGGADLRGNLELANGLTAERKKMEDSIIKAFGKDAEGSIASKLRLSITQAAKGDAANLNRVLNLVPKDLRREAVASAIVSATRPGTATSQGFGFAEFAKTYKGLRANTPVYKRIIDELGPEGHQVMESLYQVSKRVTDARANVLTTGKANQALVGAMTAEGVVSRVLNSPVGRRAAQGASGAAGAMTAGPLGAALAPALTTSLSVMSKDRVALAGKLFREPEFQKLLTETVTARDVNPKAIQAAANSPAFRRWAKASGISNPAGWLSAAIAAPAAQPEEQEQ